MQEEVHKRPKKNATKDGVAMESPLGPANTLLDIMKKRHFLKHESLPYTLNMLFIRLSSSITKLKQINSHPNSTPFIHSLNSLLKKRKTNVYRFLMFMSKE